MEFDKGQLSVLIRKLRSGSYWLRIYRRPDSQPIAEYGLRTE
jgi:hypothetical protein